MSCDISSGRVISCKDATGGIKAMFVHNFGFGSPEVATPIEQFPGFTETANVISALGVATTGIYEVYRFELRREMAMLDVQIQTNPENGTTFFEQVFTVNFNKLNQTDADKMRVLAYGRPQIILQDNMDNLIVIGGNNGCDVTAGSITTGQMFGDKNGSTITFTGKEQIAFYTMTPPTAGTEDETNYPFYQFGGASPTITVTA